jgi:glucose/arabinose dehydrogenase
MKIYYFLGIILLAACTKIEKQLKVLSQASATVADTLPAPYATPSASKFSVTLGWPADKKPIAPPGFTVTKYAASFDSPRWIYQAPNGDIFIAESKTASNSANRITILRDADKNGVPEIRQTFLAGLNKPLGMLILNGFFYVANTDGIWRYPYQTNQLSISSAGTKILSLPAGGYNNHWTRNIIANAAGTKIYVSVGSASNVAEHGMAEENRRAGILEINPDGTGEKIYASGIRNPVGMDWAPTTNILWTSVNERDNLGDNLVPDYLIGVKQGGFYGWPYAYFGQHEDPRLKGQRPDLVAASIIPDVDLGSHTASVGFTFYNKTIFPAPYRGSAFIGQHGSWNRSVFSGFRVAFVPFTNGKPTGSPQDFLTGFVANASRNEVYGRPAGVHVLADGSLLVADDAGNCIWRVAYTAPTPANNPPIAKAGKDITLPLSWNYDPLVDANQSTDPGGWIKAFQWARISGPTTCTILTPNTGKTRIHFTQTGTYIFRVYVTDNLGAVSTDDVQITVIP